eukprot:m.26225 g.26225  ORF g.26225 m.26225 type:complete len:105 (-) comp9250_c0_seq4:1176-1490(-)
MEDWCTQSDGGGCCDPLQHCLYIERSCMSSNTIKVAEKTKMYRPSAVVFLFFSTYTTTILFHVKSLWHERQCSSLSVQTLIHFHGCVGIGENKGVLEVCCSPCC